MKTPAEVLRERDRIRCRERYRRLVESQGRRVRPGVGRKRVVRLHPFILLYRDEKARRGMAA